MDTYAAGLIDGEGWIGISHVKGANTYAIRVQVAMVTKGSPVLSRMLSHYSGRITKRPPETDRHAEKDVWVVDGKSAYAFLSAIEPHLILKGRQAHCAMELWESILTSRIQRGRSHWNDELRRHARHLMLEIQDLNARGPAPEPLDLPRLPVVAEYRWGEWWAPEATLFGPTPFVGKIPTAGRMIGGVMMEMPPYGGTSLLSPGLPTPRVSDGTGAGLHGQGGMDLRTAIEHL